MTHSMIQTEVSEVVMKTKPRILGAVFCAAFLLPFCSQAQDEGFMLEEGEAAAPPPVYTSELEAGIGYSSDDSFKFGEYNGLEDQGAFFYGNLTLRKASAWDDDSTEYWELIGRNLGLDNRSVHGEYGHQGQFKLSFDYDQIPHNRLDDAMTPYLGAGTPDQTLPANWVADANTVGMTNLLADLHNVKIETERQRFGGGVSWEFADDWAVTGHYRHEIKDGKETLASIFGTNGGNPRSVILAQPVDFDFDEFNAGISYTGETAQFALTYFLSLFHNNDNALVWDNAYENGTPGYSNGGRGAMGLAPDNDAHQINFSGGYNFGQTTRVSANISYGRMNQNDDFLPMTINPAFLVPIDLPRTDLNGRIDTWFVNLRLSARPMPKMDVQATYTYDDRNNKTPIDVYVRVPNDSADQAALVSSNARVNRPYGLEKHKFEIDAGYRLTPESKLSVGYEFERNNRNIAEVARTDEHTGKVRLWANPASMLSGWVEYSHSGRNGSDYQGNSQTLAGLTAAYLATLDIDTETYENDPLLRKFQYADRDQDAVNGTVTLAPNEVLAFTVSGRYTNDDYKESVLGLQKSKGSSFTFDASFTPRKDFSSFAFFTKDDYNYRQGGYQRGNLELYPGIVRTPNENFWTMKIKDDVYSAGAGFEWNPIKDKLSLKADYTFSRGLTNYIPDGDPNLTFSELPEVTSTLHSFNLTGNYQIKENLGLRLHYIYEVYKSKDFSLDNVTPNIMANVINLGNSSPRYKAHVVGLTLVYGF